MDDNDKKKLDDKVHKVWEESGKPKYKPVTEISSLDNMFHGFLEKYLDGDIQVDKTLLISKLKHLDLSDEIISAIFPEISEANTTVQIGKRKLIHGLRHQEVYEEDIQEQFSDLFPDPFYNDKHC